MSQLQIDLWNLLLSTISTFILLVVTIAGAIRYFQERKRDRILRQEELAWRKTQFILELADEFEKDVQHQVVWRLLAYDIGMPENSSISKVLGSNLNELNDSELALRYAIDDYLDFFDRLYHFTYITRALNITDIEVFGWYIAEIGKTKEICDYAKVTGFDDVLKLNKELQTVFAKKHWYKTVSKRRQNKTDTTSVAR